MSGDQEIVSVFSVDNDNCVANAKFTALFAKYPNYDSAVLNAMYMRSIVSSANTKLIAHIRGKLKGSKRGYLILGTNRQNYRYDGQNAVSKKNGSCIPVIRALHEEVTVDSTLPRLELDRYMMADAYAEKTAGTEFDLIEKWDPIITSKAAKKYDKEITKEEVANLTSEIHALRRQFSPWVFDSSKFSILWTQMQRAATKHPKAKIHYHFYDDSDHILTGSDIYIAPQLPDVTPQASDDAATSHYKDALKKALIFTPQGLFHYQNDPATGWGYKRILDPQDPQSAPFAAYFAAAGTVTKPLH